MPDIKIFIAKLNKALEWEYAAAVQYVQHAAVITGAQYEGIGKELVIHANEELAHAINVAKLVSDLGGTPIVDIEARNIAPDAITMLEQDLAGEQHAIQMYKELIGMAESLSEYGARRTLEDILIQEEEHQRDLLGALGR